MIAAARMAAALTAALVALASAAGGEARAAVLFEPQQNWALIVHTGPAGTADARHFATLLRESYGFDADTVTEIYDGDATLEAVNEAMDLLLREFRPYDRLLVYFSLPITGSFEEPSLLLADSDPSSPWTMISLSAFGQFLNQLPSSSGLVVFPSCPEAMVAAVRTGYSRRRGRLFDILESGKRPGPIEVMQICDRDMAELSRTGEQLRTDSLPIPERRGVLIGRLSRILEDAIDVGRSSVTADELVERLTRLEPDFTARIIRIPEHRRDGWTFVYTPLDFGQYRLPYIEAVSSADRQRVLSSMVSSAAKSGDDLTPLTAFLRGLALDANALLPRETSVDDMLRARRDAVGALARVDTVAARDALRAIAAQADDAPSVRRAAVTVLSQSGNYGAEERATLLAALEDDDVSVREAAIRGAISRKDDSFMENIAALVLDDSSDDVRVVAIQAVSVLGPVSHGDVVVAALGDAAPEVRSQAAAALGRMGRSDVATSRLLTQLRSDVSGTAREAAASALARTVTDASRDNVVRALRDAAKDSATGVAVAATYSLGQIGGRSAEASLLRLLKDDARAEPVRVAAAESLGQLRSKRAMRELEKTANSSSANLRRASVEAIGLIGDDEAVEILVAKVSDDDQYVRDASLKALEGLEDPARDSLLATLSNVRAPDTVRAESLKKLASTDHPRNVDILIRSLGDGSAAVRDVAIDELSRRDDPDVIARVGRALGIEDRSPLGPLVPGGVALGAGRDTGFSERTVLLHRSAATALGRSLNPLAREQLLRAAADPANPARLEIVQALSLVECTLPGQVRRLGSTRVYQTPRSKLKTTVDECQVRGGEYPPFDDPAFIEVMLEASNDRDDAVRAAAVAALATSTDDDAVRSRLEILAVKDDSAEVRSTAIRVLGQRRAKSLY